ncbi:helix-turn-helix domain-containing protein [Streptomyces sp. NPDC001407]|uniref:helix-turn-helix domain-containing protein n=1 Tax=Streptomyces sp. NPDC001407 TaxID=3364573 RepID=UPI003675B028
MSSRGVAGFDAEALRALRTAAGFSQHKLAGHAREHGAQVAGPHICLYERGRRTPELRTLTALASALDVPLSALLEDDPTPSLYWLRMRKGMSQRGLAAALGIAQARWSRIERGQSTLDEQQVPLAAKLLGVKVSQFRMALATARRSAPRS